MPDIGLPEIGLPGIGLNEPASPHRKGLHSNYWRAFVNPDVSRSYRRPDVTRIGFAHLYFGTVVGAWNNIST